MSFRVHPSIPLRPFLNPAMIDVDRMSYEELLALGELIGKVSKGLTREQISKIPTVPYKKNSAEEGVYCAICQYTLKVMERVKELPCGHTYHAECIVPWLKVQKSCPICWSEVNVDK
eukprot:TRINITY_DN6415_c0_g1_i1.p2 TRINITY_DN6415_c0_g1~~TRINITY_DN6415_c0_g1_i1.p2  ORF type:complete len:117 (+),score=29.96 TRINITY_DN6415_c0_g1_i1:678-1028(+)